MIKEKPQGMKGPSLEPIVFGGVAFYLDHENKLATPIQPTKLSSTRTSSLVTKSKSMLQDKHTSLEPQNKQISQKSSLLVTPQPKSTASSPAIAPRKV